MILHGCGTALVTPFRSDGSLDEESLTKLVEWQFESGVHFLVACGTTAETPTLTHEEWLRVIGIVSQTAAGRVPVLAGCTHNSTLEAVAQSPSSAAITKRAISAGISFDATDIKPAPPSAITGNAMTSSPLRTVKLGGNI